MKNYEGIHTSMVESSGALSQTNLSNLPKCREMVTATIVFQIVSATWKEERWAIGWSQEEKQYESALGPGDLESGGGGSE